MDFDDALGMAILIFVVAAIFWGTVVAVFVFAIHYFTAPWGVCLTVLGHGGCI